MLCRRGVIEQQPGSAGFIKNPAKYSTADDGQVAGTEISLVGFGRSRYL